MPTVLRHPHYPVTSLGMATMQSTAAEHLARANCKQELTHCNLKEPQLCKHGQCHCTSHWPQGHGLQPRGTPCVGGAKSGRRHGGCVHSINCMLKLQ